MPQCSCGAWVSRAYLRVLAPDDEQAEPEACPECNGRIAAWEAYQ